MWVAFDLALDTCSIGQWSDITSLSSTLRGLARSAGDEIVDGGSLVHLLLGQLHERR